MTAGRTVSITSENTREFAEVETGQRALRVYPITAGGGGTSDVNIVEVGGVSVGGSSVPINDAGGSITVDGTVSISGGVTIQEPLTVDQATHDNLQANVTVQVQDVDVTALAPLPAGVADGDGSGRIAWVTQESIRNANTICVASPLRADDPQGSDPIWPAGFVRVDTLATLGPVVGDYVHGRTNSRGAQWVAHDGDVTIADGGNSITVDGSVSVSNFPAVQPVSDNGGSLTVDGTVAISGTVAVTQSGAWSVSVSAVTPGTGATNLGKAEDAVHTSGDVGVMALAVRRDTPTAVAANGDYIPLTTDSVGALYVRARQSTRTNLLTNSSLQLQGTDVVAGAGLGVSRTQRVVVQQYGYNGLPILTYNIASLAETLGVSITDPSALTAAGVNTNLGGLGTGGALKTGPDRDTIVNLFSSQVFNDVTTSANSALVDVSTARWAVIYIDLAEAGTPTDIRLIAQFSNDGGTTWFDYAVDQWVDLRYVDTQMPLTEIIPLNYVMGSDFRLRAVATGTTVADTFTLSADIEVIT